MFAVAFMSGVGVGLTLATLVIVLVTRYQKPIERTFSQAQSSLKKKGTVIQPEDESLTDWIKELPNETHTA